ncbi:BRCT domain-containing protein [Levilactobacillus brevis]|uniref:BRCT domain-containing protein n=1 Tax=Levilactobacillus brevis TaxID=1580 RepID=UPI001BA6D7D4|nr:BRCT domain-containing protein [Levilactobacillus brevis]MBS1007063.1 BRCT domain-containing protein [Levilactobacillus brevis]MBS1014179.1 BRCT domain-containing protein [Levilactobacillus brevis]
MLDLRDCKIVFTGRLTTMTREQAFSLADVFGAKPQTWITKQTDYLIVGLIEISLDGEPTTKKLLTGTPTLSERDFLAWCQARLTQWSRSLDH